MQIKYLIITVALCSAMMACGGEQKGTQSSSQSGPATSDKNITEGRNGNGSPKQSITPKRYNYRIVAEYPHSTASYTQGLEYVDGIMWEGTGQWEESQLQQIDLSTGKVKVLHKLDDSLFGEGITHFKDRIYQLTWMNQEAHIYDSNGKWLKSIPYTGEGWGITTDNEKLYMSDGSSNIYIVDPETLQRKGAINVKYGKRPQKNINELEWIEGKIWANIYLEDKIVIIDPATGVVEAYIDMRSLNDTQQGNTKADVLNGIAYNSATGHIYVTGKYWDKLFEIEITK